MLEAPNRRQARFITFEGGEGVGKSTQVKRLLANLANVSVEAVRTREPGGTPKAEAIRSFILQGRSEAWGAGAKARAAEPPPPPPPPCGAAGLPPIGSPFCKAFSASSGPGRSAA